MAIIGVSAVLGAFGVLAVPTGAGAVTANCTGALAPGTYDKVVVPAGAVCTSDGFIKILGGLTVGRGATVVFGDETSPGPVGSIGGGVYADRAASVRIHFMTITGNVSVLGGSGPFGPPEGVTWIAIEDNVINGSVSVNGYNGFWFGFIRNTVGGSVSMTNNVVLDPDGNEYVTNTIRGSLWCSGNSPAPQIGDSGGLENVVNGSKGGQCVTLVSPPT
jgi:hypothetical protein